MLRALCLLGPLLLAGCGPGTRDVAGTYRAEWAAGLADVAEFARESRLHVGGSAAKPAAAGTAKVVVVIELRADGSFVERLDNGSGGDGRERSGRWSHSGRHITLTPEVGEPQRGTWSAQALQLEPQGHLPIVLERIG